MTASRRTQQPPAIRIEPHSERGATLQAKSAMKTRLPPFYARWAEGLLVAERIEEDGRTAQTAWELGVAPHEQGHEAEALCVAADVATVGRPPAFDAAAGYFARAKTIATDLGMRPLLARCH